MLAMFEEDLFEGSRDHYSAELHKSISMEQPLVN